MDIGKEKKKIVSDPITVPVPKREPQPAREPSPEPVQPEKEPVKV
jgi:hypothetical protein